MLPPTHSLPLKQVLIGGVTLLVGIWFNAVWILSSINGQPSKARNLNILTLNLDGNSVGQALLDSTNEISGTFENARFVTGEQGHNWTYDSAYEAVWRGHYYGAIIAMPDATLNFNNAVEGANTTYDPTTAVLYVWNELRWATISEGYVLHSLQLAVEGMRDRLLLNWTSQRLSANETQLSQAGLQILLSGPSATNINICDFAIGVKPFLNSVGMVFPALIQFFFSLALGGAATHAGLHARLSVSQNYFFRLATSVALSCIVGLSWGLWYLAFREGAHNISAGQYCLVWLIFWIYGLIAWEVLDCAKAFVKIDVLPLCALTYVILNVSASIFPIELKPVFFRLDYIWPSYNSFELFITVLSHGSTSRIYRNVPVLFGWLIVWMPLGWLANRHRCVTARAAARSLENSTEDPSLGTSKETTQDELMAETV